jgi:hypothetical protein
MLLIRFFYSIKRLVESKAKCLNDRTNIFTEEVSFTGVSETKLCQKIRFKFQ